MRQLVTSGVFAGSLSYNADNEISNCGYRYDLTCDTLGDPERVTSQVSYLVSCLIILGL